MKVTLLNIGKSYNSRPIITGFNYTFEEGKNYVLLGGNGSGKSTLIKIISGAMSPNQGTVSYLRNNSDVNRDKVYREVGFAAPYIDLIMDYNLIEVASFHFKIKPLMAGLKLSEVPDVMGLTEHKTKPLKQLSSGMLQRVKLGLSILTNASLLLLDEPTTNLDTKGENWYASLIKQFCNDKTIIVCSNNNKVEYAFCNEEVNLENYK